MVFTIISGPVGLALAMQSGDIELPAILIGINVVAQKDTFWDTTQGKCHYMAVGGTPQPEIERNELDRPYREAFRKRYGRLPTYTAATHTAIKYTLVPVIEQIGSLDADKIVAVLEKREYKVPGGMVGFDTDAQGRQTQQPGPDQLDHHGAGLGNRA